MAVLEYYVKGSDSGNSPGRNVPLVFYDLNEKQQVVIFGMDFDAESIQIENDDPTKDYQRMGKLESLSVIFSAQLTNSLVRDNWDFDKYPNPEVMIIMDRETEEYYKEG